MSSGVLWLASAGLEITWLYAWAAFTLTLIHDRPYGSVRAAATFAGASLVALGLRAAKAQKLEQGLVHAVMLLLLTLASVHSVLGSFALGSPGLQAWLALLATLGWSGALWLGGARHGYLPASYARVCLGFDRAVGWLAALFSLKLLLRGQAGVNLNDGVTSSLVGAFFLFGVVALALARSRGSAQKHFVSRYRAAAALLGVGSGITLLTLALGLLLLPQLTAAAKLGYASLQQAGGPLATALAQLMFLLLYLWWLIRGPHQAAPPLRQQTVSTDPRPQYREQALIKLAREDVWLSWGARVLLAAIVLAFLFWLVWRLKRLGWQAAFARLRLRWSWQRAWLPEPVRLYRALCRWGRRSGLAARASETPLEYAQRLEAQLPALQPEIAAIVAAFNAHLYAPRTQPQASLARERAALRRLRSPRHWRKRIKLWLDAPHDVEPEPRPLNEHVVTESEVSWQA